MNNKKPLARPSLENDAFIFPPRRTRNVLIQREKKNLLFIGLHTGVYVYYYYRERINLYFLIYFILYTSLYIFASVLSTVFIFYFLDIDLLQAP